MVDHIFVRSREIPEGTMSWIRERTLHWFQFLGLKIIKTGHVPRHVAFIMDGNRRFATKNNAAKVEGHKQGYVFLTEVLKYISLISHTPCI